MLFTPMTERLLCVRRRATRDAEEKLWQRKEKKGVGVNIVLLFLSTSVTNTRYYLA